MRTARPRWVAGALGPTNKTLSLSPDVNDPGYREVDFDLVSDVYVEQIEALVEGGVDFVLIETVFDTLNAKAAIHAARRVDPDLPIMVSMTITDLSRAQSVGPFDRELLGLGPPRPAAVDRAQLLVRRRPAARRISPLCRRSPTLWSWPIPMPACPTISANMTNAPRPPPPRSANGASRASSTSSAAAAAPRRSISARSRRR